MEPLKLNITVPFRIDGIESEHPGCLKHFDARHIREYLTALEKDIASSAEGMEDFQVLEIEFSNGSFTHLGAGNLNRIMACIRRHYRLHPEVRLTLNATPAALDFFIMTEAKQAGNAHIVLDIPALDDEKLRDAGFFTDSSAAKNALDSYFQNGFKNMCCVVSPRICASVEIFTDTLSQIAARKPDEIRFNTDCGEDYLSAAEELLKSHGYKPARTPGCWYRDAAPFHRYFPDQIGCGPYSISVINGQAVRTTPDFNFYCAHSDDFEALLTHQD